MADTVSPFSPRWMFHVLIAAGIYNLFWGAVVVLLPNLMWDLLELPRPNYPQLWQCIGMIVGVYGIGYLIAAIDPVRHWPIVLVGFLGKIFGPIGFFDSWWRGELPTRFGLNLITNDFIWWVPFALILRHAWRMNAAAAERRIADAEARFQEVIGQARVWSRADSEPGPSLAELSDRQPLLIVFLRHFGCTFCREAVADVAARRGEIDRMGAKVVFVHMSPNDSAAGFFERHGFPDAHWISDPERTLYRAFGLRQGTAAQILNWRVWTRGFLAAFRDGHGIGSLEGDGLQMPGAFVLAGRTIRNAFVHRTPADRPDYLGLIDCKACVPA
jgi:peroxiredoxin